MNLKGTSLAAAFMVSFGLATMPHGSHGGEPAAAPAKIPSPSGGTQSKRPGGSSAAEQGKDRPRLIVLPLQPEEGQAYDGTGLAVHFLLGNIVALHTGFREFWFGWRVKRIFQHKERLTAYCRAQGPSLDIPGLGREQGIRYWLEGRYRQQGPHIRVTLILRDMDNDGGRISTGLTLNPGNRVMEFCETFLAWLEGCGYPLSDTQRARAVWQENISSEGLDLLGRAMEYYYLHISWKEEGPLDLRLFDHAAAAAPASYLTHDFRGWALYRNKDYRAAEDAFGSALVVNPNGLGAVSGMMWCAISTGRREAAIKWAEAKADLRRENREAARSFVAGKMKN